MNRGTSPRCWRPRSTRRSTFRGSCGFLLIAIDNLGRLNEAYGFDVADEVIARSRSACAPRCAATIISAAFSGNKFGVMLTNCTPDDMARAAERLLAGVRDEP